MCSRITVVRADQLAPVQHEPLGRRGGDGLLDGGGADGQQLGREAGLDADLVQAHGRAGAGADGRVGRRGLQVAGGDQQRGRLKRVAATHGVERVAQVVAACGQRHAGVQQRVERGQSTGRGRAAATLEEQAGLRAAHHREARRRGGRRHPFGHAGRLRAEADAVAGGGAPLQARGGHQLGQVLEPEDPRVERLVHVQVERPAERGSQLDAELQAGPGVGVELGAAADRVGATGHRLAKRRAVVRAGRAAERRAWQGDQLQVELAAERLAHLDQRVEGAHADGPVDVDVAADRGGAVAEQQQGGPGRALHHVAPGDRRPLRLPCRDGAAQVARPVARAPSREGLVEMGVRLGGRGQQQVPGELHPPVPRRRPQPPGGGHRGDPAPLDPHVDRLAAGNRHAAEHQARRRRGDAGLRQFL
jgi:hypothetical protein